MKFSKVLTILFIKFSLIFCNSEDESELIAVTALIRHGTRIPVNTYPTDPYRNYSWPYVLGDLTNEGIKEMFRVGEFLRAFYSPRFLSKNYKPDEIYSHSVEFDRCLMSAEAVMAGLYPPNRASTWDKHLKWQPIPIHSSPALQDILTNMLFPCPTKITEAGNLIVQSPYYPQIMEKYGSLFNYISEKSGLTANIYSLYPFFDALFSEKKLGLALPDWAEKIYPDLFPLVVLYTKLNSINFNETKIQIGPLVTRIVKQFDNAITGNNFGTTNTIYRKFMAYFSTEWMLYDFTYGLGLDSIGVPEYGAFFLLELRRKNGTYFINILYKNDTSLETNAVPWHIKGQNFNMEYESFKKLVEPLKTNTTEWVPLCESLVNAVPQLVEGVPMS